MDEDFDPVGPVLGEVIDEFVKRVGEQVEPSAGVVLVVYPFEPAKMHVFTDGAMSSAGYAKLFAQLAENFATLAEEEEELMPTAGNA